MAPPNETACPEGFNLNAKQLGEKLGTEPPNDCENPTAHEAPEFFTLDSPGVILGMDLDATTSSRAAGGALPGGMTGDGRFCVIVSQLSAPPPVPPH